MRCNTRCSRAWPSGPRVSQRRQSAAAITGSTIYRTTDSSSVSQGTVMEAMPSSRATIGAKAKTMITSFSATCDRVKPGWPSLRLLQTNTIAVQGAAASRIRPAM